MKRICVAFDKWKLSIFEKAFDEAGFKYTQGRGLTTDTLHLYINVPDNEVIKLAEITQLANSKATKSKSKGWS